MKKTLILAAKTATVCAALSLLIVSCSKEANTAPKPTQQSVTATTELMKSNDVSKSISASGVTRTYNVRGSRTQFRGLANEAGDNVVLSLDYAGVKDIKASKSDKGLVCNYGEPFRGTDLGWQYIIGYDKATKTITLAPNDAMIAGIVAGSFKTLYVYYDAPTKNFTFITRYVDAVTGNESEVTDILTQQ